MNKVTDLKSFLSKLHTNLNILREREAKYGSDAPLDLTNQIEDHNEAVTLTEQAIAGSITETDWQTGILPLALSSALLDMAAKITPDLQLHERAYRQRLKEHYGEDAPYYIPLTGETTEIIHHHTEAQVEAPRSTLRRRSRAQAEYHEWIQTEQEIKRVKLDTLREGVDKYPCIILLGDPGSGKTTALEHLAYQFADELDELPLPLRLSEFGPELTIDGFIKQGWGGSPKAGYWGAPELAANLDSYLEAGQLFFLFDALNEMPRQGYRGRAQALRGFIDEWSHKGNRFLVTCRVLDYGEELSGLQRIEIQPLSDDQIQAFLRNELPQTWAALWHRLTEGGDDRHRLLEMARNPYVLTMMIDIFAEDGRLGENRAELLRRFSQILLNWAREIYPPDEWLGADVLQEALAITAFEMQDRAGSGAVAETRHLKKLMPSQVQTDPNYPPDDTSPDQVLNLAAGANIIEMPVDRSSVRFYHQLLQEYFAAQAMLKQAPDSLTERWRWPWLESEMPLWLRPEDNWDPLPPPPPTGWEETTILAAGLATENDDQLVRALIAINPVLAGRCLHEGQAKVTGITRQAVVKALLTTIVRPEVALRVRIAAGEALGYLGDPRLGELVTVPAGEFLMGTNRQDLEKTRLAWQDWTKIETPQHKLFLPDYQVGKYPVTNAEYGRFIEAGGYEDERWWTEAGWQTKERNNWTEPSYWKDDRFNKPNYPVVGVSWYESVAYCRWLRAETDQPYRLPTEAEWEKAARGTEGWIYPWGNEFEASRLNAFEGEQQVRATTPVGIYPTGISPFGTFDCAGIVWEWCATRWRKDYPYNCTEDEWTADYLVGPIVRVLRGGSWNPRRNDPRCAYRDLGPPDLRGVIIGFRCLCSPI